jgi:predicted pyridoxine 5'-phosphate oxidase superfamily flavin-nucleotide-binding protein
MATHLPAAMASLHRITGTEELEAIIGRAPDMVLMKQIDALDEGCRRILAAAPLAGFGYCDAEGRPHTTFVGGNPGFAHVDSPRRISLRLPAAESSPADASAVSFVFLLPGVGETLRLNGSVARRAPGRLVVAVEQAYIHCARAILRSRLWKEARPAGAAQAPADDGPLADPEITNFLSAAPFLVVSSWDGSGGSDTSPRGDSPGFMRVLDARTLAVADRRGNKRADTFHNLLTDDRISAAVMVPERTEVLHLSGTAIVTDDVNLLAGMALGGKPPPAALVIAVERATVRTSEAIEAAKVWDQSRHVDKTTIPDLMSLAGQHLAANRSGGVKAKAMRLLMKPINAFPALGRRLIDAGYRQRLKSEGYTDDSDQRGPGRGD